MQQQIAIISDVHGNLTALEAVLAHIRASSIERIFNLGDLIGKGPRSAAAVDRCRETCEVILQGNWDAEIGRGIGRPWPMGDWHREQLGPERVTYLEKLPGTFDFVVSGRQTRFFHASQTSVFDRVHANATREQHRNMFTNTPFTGSGPEPQMVGYGDVHTAYVLNFEGRTLFNVGSVGNSLDIPLACYAVLSGDFDGGRDKSWSLNLIRLEYDVEAEIAVARASGMPECEAYERELRTAVHRGR